MKKVIILLVLLWGCKKDDAVNKNNPPAIATQTVAKSGNIIFYCKDTSLYHKSLEPVEVWLNWKSTYNPGKYLGKITNMPEGVPSCGSWWGLNYSDTIYSHTYHAKQTNSPYKVWDGAFTLTPDGCIKVELMSP